MLSLLLLLLAMHVLSTVTAVPFEYAENNTIYTVI